MTDIPKGALDRAWDLAMQERNEHSLNTGAHHYRDALARFIADVSEKAREAVEQSTFAGQLPAHIAPLQSLILPDPESDLLKEAREIVKRFYPDMPDDYFGRRVQVALAALKHRKDG